MLLNTRADIEQALKYLIPGIAITSIRPYNDIITINHPDTDAITFRQSSQIFIGDINFHSPGGASADCKFIYNNGDNIILNLLADSPTYRSMILDEISCDSDCNIMFVGYLVSYSS